MYTKTALIFIPKCQDFTMWGMPFLFGPHIERSVGFFGLLTNDNKWFGCIMIEIFINGVITRCDVSDLFWGVLSIQLKNQLYSMANDFSSSINLIENMVKAHCQSKMSLSQMILEVKVFRVQIIIGMFYFFLPLLLLIKLVIIQYCESFWQRLLLCFRICLRSYLRHWKGKGRSLQNRNLHKLNFYLLHSLLAEVSLVFPF